MRNKLLLTVALVFCAAVDAQTNSYTVSSIVTNSTDARLVNPWGLSRPASSKSTENEWWTSDQVTGLSTLYYANGTVEVALQVTASTPSGTTGAGQPDRNGDFNPTNNNFAFASHLDDGNYLELESEKPRPRGTGCALRGVPC